MSLTSLEDPSSVLDNLLLSFSLSAPERLVLLARFPPDLCSESFVCDRDVVALLLDGGDLFKCLGVISSINASSRLLPVPAEDTGKNDSGPINLSLDN